MTTATLTSIPLSSLPKVSQGKVRDLFSLPDDRISAYDVILKNGIPTKGIILTLLSAKWFEILSSRVPGLKHHFLHLGPPSESGVVSPEEAQMLRGRSMTVRSFLSRPSAIRGYVTGSAWAEYSKTQTIHGLPAPVGLKRCEKLPQPIYTPSTKAELGEKDINISPEQACKIIGEKYASRIEQLALACYKAGAAYAEERGIIIADTKFEFGLDEETDEIYLVDEVLTPDSSRFWSKEDYEVGREQDSFDKQVLRNWLTDNGLKGKPDVEMPSEVVEKTKGRYTEVFERLTGTSLEDALKALGN
ncbi:phosphoribosylaminoimidazole-succinocarboxamide synthase-like protein [Thermochaetoides thermophila DSM 1495]|uniref:Phosphoribosylaminoimidazole-succinocarboxamide synthase n=1 Tax=Chaetomium thermophilum (strain DSM 1495 / CBS 144.50 / IMI 039719) TaxID=759272 RepID=G0SEP7_CHATD|nr:phosphoribosylaminoimidazole-succinocarboxamide synthase-like protein [Thermochaetoides thermophila DSM 1495]EGS18424.1 phosphoribosylaminoimidazole-succinocarboxamide synthase-like protein [Thermochaetoides thermophila DSM 1495]